MRRLGEPSGTWWARGPKARRELRLTTRVDRATRPGVVRLFSLRSTARLHRVNALAAHQGAAIGELIEWWEDLHDRSTGSQLATLVVPPGWGRTTVLNVLAERI